MIDVQKAVLAAQDYFNSLQDFMSQNGTVDIQDLRLEEVELSEDKHYWFITFGYNLAKPEPKYVLIASGKSDRIYKIFKINSETSEVESMKIR